MEMSWIERHGLKVWLIVVLLWLGLLLVSCASDHQQQALVGPVELYAHETGHLHPEKVRILLPWFIGHEETFTALRIHVLSPLEAEATAALGMPAITVLGHIWVVIPGVLDADGVVRGRVFSWTQPKGIALWAHEALHVQQFEADPLTFLYDAVRGICLSIQDGDLYEHQYFPYEVEAIAFERRIRAALEAQCGPRCP